MAIITISFHCRVRRLWLLKAVNFPLLLLGLKPWVPRICIEAKVVSDAA